MHVLCVVYVFVCHACVRVGSGPPYSVWQGGPSVCVCACVREHVCVFGWWRWNELERKETGDGGGERRTGNDPPTGETGSLLRLLPFPPKGEK